MTESDHAALVELLKHKNLNACPACGNPDWIISKEPFFLSFVNQDLEMPGFRAIALFCSNCGLMHFHNYAALKADPEILKRTAEKNEEANNEN
jgi:hypothetical protein